ncbi:hypothetical protein [Acinetobacter nectaris]|uniref:hypothetical protein n=1 Tax=Acinetobacter nectaris TaxID=1219382 RepID=UPI001F275E6D|nr:hypothetical protein [Acinetobacter nectaris]MCF8999444.1 hypothetical protein [Acinetobacter nectaris]MCF9027088.1 hypothetical protein [Acinetobacter nectaris]
MALDIGEDFKTRWLNTPQAARQTYIDDLSRICELLTPESDIDEWKASDALAQTTSEQKIQHAYEVLKAQMIEDARCREQKRLENKIYQQRQAEDEYLKNLQLDDRLQQQSQVEQLKSFQSQLMQETKTYSNRYQKTSLAANSPKATDKPLQLNHVQLQQIIENIQVRLELEAESLIEQIQKSVEGFNQNLQQAAEEEVKISLQDTKKKNSA